MQKTVTKSGKCLCNTVRFTAIEVDLNVGACHCGMCRNWGGGPLMATNCGSKVEFEDESAISVYDSSEWAERGFCRKCGSHLFYRLKGDRQHFIPAGLFEDQSGFVFDHQVFIDKKPAYYDFANDTENMTEQQVFDKYG